MTRSLSFALTLTRPLFPCACVCVCVRASIFGAFCVAYFRAGDLIIRIFHLIFSSSPFRRALRCCCCCCCCGQHVFKFRANCCFFVACLLLPFAVAAAHIVIIDVSQAFTFCLLLLLLAHNNSNRVELLPGSSGFKRCGSHVEPNKCANSELPTNVLLK